MEQRGGQLARTISTQLALGNRRIESQSDFSAVIVQGKPVNHVLHLILSVLTFGFWIIVWILMAVGGGEQREMLTVDEYGFTSIQKL